MTTGQISFHDNRVSGTDDLTDITVIGKMIKVAGLSGEYNREISDPAVFARELAARGVKADIITFIQRIPDTTPKYNYAMEWDNMAALPITTFDHWWVKQINDKTRNLVRKAEKKGVLVRNVPFNDELVAGIASIYNETRIRQGRLFWHYGKNTETIKKQNQLYLEKSDFIGAYYQNELVGFIRLVYEEKFASIMYILSKIEHRDKAANNALLAHAVRICAQKGIPFLVYARFSYGKKGEDKLTDFKRHHGFEKMDVPRYFLPLTFKGRIALRLRIHWGIKSIIPKFLYAKLVELRNKWNAKKNHHKHK